MTINKDLLLRSLAGALDDDEVEQLQDMLRVDSKGIDELPKEQPMAIEQSIEMLEGQTISTILINNFTCRAGIDGVPRIYSPAGEDVTDDLHDKWWEDAESIEFWTEEGNKYWMGHHQDCCECVYIADVDGDFLDLIGSKVGSAKEATSDATDPIDQIRDELAPACPPTLRMKGLVRALTADEVVPDTTISDSGTWTFYTIQTSKGYLWLRWLGESNGYYGESVSFEHTNAPTKEL